MTGLVLTTSYFFLVALLHLLVAVWILRFPRRVDRVWFAATGFIWCAIFIARAVWPFSGAGGLADTAMLIGAVLLPMCWVETAIAFRQPLEKRKSIARIGVGTLLVVAWLLACKYWPPLRAEDSNGWVFAPLLRLMFASMLIYSAAVLTILERGFRERRGRLRRLLYPALGATVLQFGVVIYIGVQGFLFSQFNDFMWWVLSVPTVAWSFTGAAVLAKPAETPGELSPRGAYASGAVLVLGGYLMFLGVLGKLIQWLGWNLEVYLSVLAGALAVLIFAVVALSPRGRKRARRYVDRNVLDSRFDFAERWREFGDPISTTLDQSELVKDIASFLQETYSPNVMVYLPHRMKRRWEMFYPFGAHDAPSFVFESEASDWLWRRGEPVELAAWHKEVAESEEADRVGQLHERFDAALVIPLVARQEMFGWILLGRKHDGLDFDHQDFEFLTSMSGPVALALLTCRVSEELIEKRELESFHRLSTFVVHDLKNSVAMLSMLLQNARKSMDDPRFQREALETITDAVGRMQRLIHRVSMGATPIEARRTPIDLVALVREVAESAGILRNPKIEFQIAEEAEDSGRYKALADPADVRKVFENLLINAVEAMRDSGHITVTAGFDDSGDADGIVTLRISDSGSGMTDEFIDTQLFRPFQSTKSKGLGIGLFQVREMIERAGGYIAVESRTESPSGTTFTIGLPRATAINTGEKNERGER